VRRILLERLDVLRSCNVWTCFVGDLDVVDFALNTHGDWLARGN
jgi:hypothetical protein